MARDHGVIGSAAPEAARQSARVPWLLIAAPTVVLLLFFALPNALLLLASFVKSEAQQLTNEVTLDNYAFLFSRSLYIRAFIRTFIVGLSVGLLDVVLGYPLAYFSSQTRPGVELPAKFAANQITTKEQIAKTQFPDSEVIGARRKDWTVKWQEIMG